MIPMQKVSMEHKGDVKNGAAVLSSSASVSVAGDRAVCLRNAAGDLALVSPYGAQVLSWFTSTGGEMLYCSPHAPARQGQAIRGGVPVCFPQFSKCGPFPALAKHGFARTTLWNLDGPPSEGAECAVASVRYALQDTAKTLLFWPHSFALELQINLGPGWLELQLKVMNTGSSTFEFTAALHTYLATADVAQASVHGLEGITFKDATKHNTTATQTSDALLCLGELDRVYMDTPRSLQLQQNGRTRLQVEQQGFADTVVWNPGAAKATALGDMPASDWARMLCIEAAQIEHPVQLKPGEAWRGAQRMVQSTAK